MGYSQLGYSHLTLLSLYPLCAQEKRNHKHTDLGMVSNKSTTPGVDGTGGPAAERRGQQSDPGQRQVSGPRAERKPFAFLKACETLRLTSSGRPATKTRSLHEARARKTGLPWSGPRLLLLLKLTHPRKDKWKLEGPK